ncbi:MAG: adenosylcobinamide amidohydrolase [Haloferacaceae archaeon]
MTVFDPTVRDGVCRLARPGARWLSTGHGGGVRDADAAYNVTVPGDWTPTDLDAYARERRERAGFDADGPALFTAVDQADARRARLDGVEAVVTAGLTNPTVLPVGGDGRHAARRETPDDRSIGPGTVNVVVGTNRALGAGALTDLVAAAAEAKAATLTARAGVAGTTTDAVVAACDPGGDPADFAGAATPVGRAARVCVRDALTASLEATHGGDPPSPDGAAHGVVLDGSASVSRL